jgi:hypothetical protein
MPSPTLPGPVVPEPIPVRVRLGERPEKVGVNGVPPGGSRCLIVNRGGCDVIKLPGRW